MWIYNKNIFLKIIFQHKKIGTNLSVKVLNQDLHEVGYENLSRIDSSQQIISTKIDMPTLLYLVLDEQNFSPTTVVDISLGNIPFDKKIIPQVFEYKMNYEQKAYSIDEMLSLDSHKTVSLDYSGIMCFNFFDKDPVKYHMNLGNKITACKKVPGDI